MFVAYQFTESVGIDDMRLAGVQLNPCDTELLTSNCDSLS